MPILPRTIWTVVVGMLVLVGAGGPAVGTQQLSLPVALLSWVVTPLAPAPFPFVLPSGALV